MEEIGYMLLSNLNLKIFGSKKSLQFTVSVSS